MSVKGLQELWLKGEINVPVSDWRRFLIQRGEAWRGSHYEVEVDVAESLEILLRVGEHPPTIVPHIHVGANTLWYAYEDFDYSDEGAPIPVANYKRNAPDGSLAAMELFAQPTITRYGFGFGPVFIPAGNTKDGPGMMYSPRWEIVLGRNYETVFRLENISGVKTGMYIELSWYHAAHIDARTGTPVE